MALYRSSSSLPYCLFASDLNVVPLGSGERDSMPLSQIQIVLGIVESKSPFLGGEASYISLNVIVE